MITNQYKTIKIFLFLFLLSIIIINWDTVSWIFNYRELRGLTSDFLNPYQNNNVLVSADNTIVKANNTKTLNNLPSNNYQTIDSTFLSIPAIAVTTPLIMSESTDLAILEEKLDQGAVYYPGSVLPGQNGQIVILGHSAPPNWPKIKHDYIFSDIEKLTTQDQIILHFNNKEYIYKIIGKNIIQKGDDIGTFGLNGKNNVLAIVSCWPPGKDYKRIAVFAELQN